MPIEAKPYYMEPDPRDPDRDELKSMGMPNHMTILAAEVALNVEDHVEPDIEFDPSNVEQIKVRWAAGVYLYDDRFPDYTIVVERNNESMNYCMPCGKVDPWETIEDAAIRELFEETGIQITADQLEDRYVRRAVEQPPWLGSGETLYTAIYKAPYDFTDITFTSSKEGQVHLIENGYLMGKNCTFNLYNRDMLKAFDLL